jgi:DNA primase
MGWLDHFDLEEYLDDAIGIARRASGAKGEEYICDCPFCGKLRKFYANAEMGVYICYSCEEQGALPHLIMELDGVSYRQAVEKITKSAEKRLSLSLEDVRAKQHRRKEKRARKSAVGKHRPKGESILPAEYKPVWDPKRRKKLRVPYIEDTRGFTLETSRRFRLGVCTEGDYSGRVVFPIIEHGQIVSFQARAMGKWEPKYMNPGHLGKGQFIYGHDMIVGDTEPVIVEGPTDVISCYQKGIMACAPLGKTITRQQISKLRKAGARSACLLLDGNAVDSALKAAALMIEVMDVKVARLPGKMDPDEAPIEIIEETLRAATPPSLRELRRARASL